MNDARIILLEFKGPITWLIYVGIFYLFCRLFHIGASDLKFLTRECRDLIKFRHTVGSLNFLGIIALSFVLLVLIAKDEIHLVYSLIVAALTAPKAHELFSIDPGVLFLSVAVFAIVSIWIVRNQSRRG